MKKFRKFISNRIEFIPLLLREYEKSGKEETLHDLRVELKKLKSAFHLAGFSLKNINVKRRFNTYRTIFKEAGKIRSDDVIIGLMKKYGKSTLSGAIKRKEEECNRLRSAFRKKIPKILKRLKKQEKKDREISDNITRKDLRKFILKKDKKIRARMKGEVPPAVMHDVRKSIKEIIYFSSLIKVKSVSFDSYKVLQEYLGKWHDKVVVSAYFENSRNRRIRTLINQLNRLAAHDLKRIRKMMARIA